MRKQTVSNEKIGIVGAGRVGEALSVLLHGKGYEIVSVVDTDAGRAESVRKACTGRSSSCRAADMQPDASLILIAVPDRNIADAGSDLTLWKNRGPAVIAHTSGLHSSDIIAFLRKPNIGIASFHPCFPFADRPGSLKNVGFAIEGDTEACMRLEKVALRLGGIPFTLTGEQKIPYHAACVMISNFMTVLVGSAGSLLPWLENGLKQQIFFPLLETTLKNIKNQGPENALTGPVLRGDAGTVNDHLEFLAQYAPSLVDIYISLSRQAVEMAVRRGLHDRKRQELLDILDRYGKRE